MGGLGSAEECTEILKRLITELARPFLIETYTIKISGSCGVTLYPTDNEELDILLRHADHAMYEAKASGKNQFKFFDSQTEMSKT
ncbi:MAG: diguanylate cyclase [Pseudomonadota bacterium]|nr:diguanylate cyclase [Pseudomonadota bacterium]MDO7667499.1 diguanylate cyclase [Pseudomonadota bacterium]MDO7711329.1 diguanylate cyclase [Pseudomonadota bacterium]